MMIDVECPEGGRHEFEFYETVHNDRGGSALVAVAECKKCPLEIGPEQMKRWLNAAVQLTAEEADDILEILPESPHWLEEYDSGFLTGLEDYATCWRGDDG